MNRFLIRYFIRPVTQEEFDTLSSGYQSDLTNEIHIELPDTHRKYLNNHWIKTHFEMFHPNSQVRSIALMCEVPK
jgi:hypothetical protein